MAQGARQRRVARCDGGEKGGQGGKQTSVLGWQQAVRAGSCALAWLFNPYLAWNTCSHQRRLRRQSHAQAGAAAATPSRCASCWLTSCRQQASWARASLAGRLYFIQPGLVSGRQLAGSWAAGGLMGFVCFSHTNSGPSAGHFDPLLHTHTHAVYPTLKSSTKHISTPMCNFIHPPFPCFFTHVLLSACVCSAILLELLKREGKAARMVQGYIVFDKRCGRRHANYPKNINVTFTATALPAIVTVTVTVTVTRLFPTIIFSLVSQKVLPHPSQTHTHTSRTTAARQSHQPPCTVPLAPSPLHRPPCTVPFAPSPLHRPPCTVPIAPSPLH
eukprot:354986-Chlamydomonas_euryale.AAC.3